MKRFTLLTSILLLLFFIACEPGGMRQQSVDEQIAEKTEEAMTEANKAVGMPNIINWNEKKLVRDLYELRDTEGLQTWTYIIDMNGNKHFLGRSIGFGIPASVQYSNPEVLRDAEDYLGIGLYHDAGRAQSMPQPEPNRLFMPEGLSATWIFLLDADNEPRPVYVEPQILVSPFPLH